MRGAAGTVERAEPFRHDALAAESAGVLEDDGPIAGKVFIQGNALERLWQQAGEPCLAILDRQSALIFAVEFDQIEGAQHGIVVVTPGPEQAKIASPASSVTVTSPSIRQECAKSATSAATTGGKRLLKCTTSPAMSD
jgi:hypothetical protein